MDPAKQRYIKGEYTLIDEDGPFKAKGMLKVIMAIPDKKTIKTYADIGCGEGSVLANIRELMLKSGFSLDKTDGYDIRPFAEGIKETFPGIDFKHEDFLQGEETYDLITMNDLLEHVSSPQEFLAKIGPRARYVALHIPLDDRLSVLLSNQYNYRIQDVGHLSFWSPATALNLITSAGLQPLHCHFSKAFLWPSGRERLIQRLAIPVRLIMSWLSPGLTAITVGGYALAVLCKGKLP